MDANNSLLWRADCLAKALDLAKHAADERTPDKILGNAGKFYAYIIGPTAASDAKPNPTKGA